MTGLTNFELDLLRKLDDSNRAMPWGATMTSAIERLYAEGYLVKKQIGGCISYKISEAGREFVSKLR